MSLDITYILSLNTWGKYGFTDVNTDSKKLKPIIRQVQKGRIEPVIGTTLYNKILSDIDSDSLSGLYKTCVDDFILPTMIAYCDWKAVPMTTNQITNKTTGRNSDQYQRANTTTENKLFLDELKKDAETYESKLKAFLCDNWESIPELCQAPDSDMLAQTIKPHLKQSGDYFGWIGKLR